MASSSKTPFSFGVNSITTHTWNGNATQIALSKNNKEVEIFNAAPGNRYVTSERWQIQLITYVILIF